MIVKLKIKKDSCFKPTVARKLVTVHFKISTPLPFLTSHSSFMYILQLNKMKNK